MSYSLAVSRRSLLLLGFVFACSDPGPEVGDPCLEPGEQVCSEGDVIACQRVPMTSGVKPRIDRDGPAYGYRFVEHDTCDADETCRDAACVPDEDDGVDIFDDDDD